MENNHFKYGVNEWTGEPNKPVFYTKDMALKIREIRKPVSDLMVDIVQYPEFLAIRLYEDNFIQYDGIKKEMVIATETVFGFNSEETNILVSQYLKF